MTEHALPAYGWDDRWSARFAAYLASPDAAEVVEPAPGRVVRHDGAGLMVALDTGPGARHVRPPVTPPPVVGDWVVLDRHHTPQATLPRDSLLRRRAAGRRGRAGPGGQRRRGARSSAGSTARSASGASSAP